MDIPIWQYLITMSIYVFFLYHFVELMRHRVSLARGVFYLAVLTFPIWIYNLDGWFRWIKTLLVLLPILFLNAIRYSYFTQSDKNDYLRKKWPIWILYLVVFANIVEASIKGISIGNHFNGIAGLILAATMLLPLKGWKIDKNNNQDLIVNFPLSWCLLYTTWNLCFVYGENPDYLASSICILLVPLFYCFYKRRTDLWLTARVYTLGIHLTIRACYDIFHPLMGSESWQNSQALYLWGALNLALHIAYGIYYLFQKIQTQKASI